MSSELISTTSKQLSLGNVYPNFWFNSVPEPIRFMTSATFGNIAFFKIDQILFNQVILPLSKEMPKVFQRNKETLSFFLSYLIQVAMQHLLNATFVYGLQTISTTEKYLETLILTYSSYSLSLIGSTIGNAVLLKQGVQKDVAFWGTILGFGVINFFLLKFLISGSGAGAEEVTEEKNSAQATKGKRSQMRKSKKGLNGIRGGQTCNNQWSHILFGRKPDVILEIIRNSGNSVVLQ